MRLDLFLVASNISSSISILLNIEFNRIHSHGRRRWLWFVLSRPVSTRIQFLLNKHFAFSRAKLQSIYLFELCNNHKWAVELEVTKRSVLIAHFCDIKQRERNRAIIKWTLIHVPQLTQLTNCKIYYYYWKCFPFPFTVVVRSSVTILLSRFSVRVEIKRHVLYHKSKQKHRKNPVTENAAKIVLRICCEM